MASSIINSIKFFNEVRNGTDFLSNTGDFTTGFKANVGEKVKVLVELDYSNIFVFNKSSIEIEVIDTPEEVITINNGNFQSLGFKNGDLIEIYSNKTNQIVAEFTIDAIGSKEIKVTSTGIFNVGTYDDGEIRLLTELNEFSFNFSTDSNIGGAVTSFSPYNVPRNYKNVDLVGDGAPRSTAFVSFIARLPENWNTGLFKMRYVSNPTTFVQRFEFEHEFIVEPFHLQGNVYSPLTAPNEFDSGTLNYNFTLNNIGSEINGERLIASSTEFGSIGWFNESFDGGANGYALTSISYYDLIEAKAINQINVDNDTRITAIVTGALFTASEPVVVYHTKAPLQEEYQDTGATYNENWINDVLRNDIGAVSNSATILKNLSINLDSPTQITIQFDVDYSLSEDILNLDKYLLYFGLEDSTLSSELSNRVNLFADYNQYLKSNDENDLFLLDKYEIYNHLQDLDVDTPSTDFEGYVEDSVLLDIEFRLKNTETAPETGNQQEDISENISLSLVCYNNTTQQVFYISRSEAIRGSRKSFLDGAWKYISEMYSTWRQYNFLLEPSDQFNSSQTSAPSILTDIEYISNDGVYGLYRAKVGIKVNWQDIIGIEENAKNKRVFSPETKTYNEDFLLSNNIKLGDVNALGIWTDATKLFTGWNRKASNWKKGDWIVKPLLEVEVENIVTNDETLFFNFMPEWKIFDYDTNSDYSATTTTSDVDDNDLNGALLSGEDNKVVITFDDATIKTDIANFEGAIRIEVKNQAGYQIHELSTLRDTYTGNILKGFGGGGLKVEKTIVADKYVLTCLIDGLLLTAPIYKITGRIWDKIFYDPSEDADLVANYDASGLITNTDNIYGTVSALDEVSNWKNLKTGAGWDLIQATLTKQPIIFTLGLGRIDFDGIDDFLYWFDNDLGSEYTIFAVVEVSDLGSANLINLRSGDLGVNPQFTDDISMYDNIDGGGNPEPRIEAYNDVSALEDIKETPSSFVISQKAVIQYSIKYNGDFYLKVDNVRHDLPTANMTTYNIGALNSFFVGAEGSKNAGLPVVDNAKIGRFHQLMVFPSVAIGTKENDVHAYLKQKWEI